VIRVLLVDDHSIVRDGLKRILAATTDLQVAGEAASGEAALALVKANDYDVAMIDMSMPGLSGIDLIKRLKLEKPKLRILVLSMHGEQQYAARALTAGAAGGVHIGEAAAASLLQAREGLPHEALSDREFEVLRLLVEGLGPTEIGERLHLSVKTVSTHKTRILEKLNVKSTAELVRYALENRLV